ncbi:MAG: radical SAM protein [Thermoplasmata archaeon]|nr:MAG: radical SAM protein [Thermoplasmata archaeon]KAA0015105.1 MAG: radical SAM protein [Thermoplasmata archaeon]
MKINEIFYSLQGEGADIGLPTIFIRLTGCNLRCKYCDTEYAFYEGKEMGLEQIMEEIGKWRCKRVCITGGEPLLQNVHQLIDALIKRRYEVSVETNGSLSIDNLISKKIVVKMDIKCPSSGMNDKMRMENINLLRATDELKFIIENREDYEYAKSVIEKYKPVCKIIMQPVWGKAKKLADWILDDEINVRFSIQLHKILWKGKRGK